MPGTRIILFAFALCAALSNAAASGDSTAVTSAIADVAVRSQNDQPLHFYSDLVKGRIVAVNFVFTSCRSVCPLLGVRFAQTQALLGDAARDVSLISISIDPVTDTPQRLAAWGRKMGAKPGWTLVTGNKPDIDMLVNSLGASAVDPASHAPLVVVIDDKHGGRWQRVDGDRKSVV